MKKIILSIISVLVLIVPLSVNAEEIMYVLKGDNVVDQNSVCIQRDPGTNTFFDCVKVGEKVISCGWELGKDGRGYNYVYTKCQYSSEYCYGWIATESLSYSNSFSESYYNCINEVNQIKSFIVNGLYLEAIKVCDETLAWHSLSELDVTLLNGLKSEAIHKYNDYLNSEYITGAKAIELVRTELRKQFGSSLDKLKVNYYYYDKGTYYLVCATATAYADGTYKYRVYKTDSKIEYIGCGSSWASDDAEYFV